MHVILSKNKQTRLLVLFVGALLVILTGFALNGCSSTNTCMADGDTDIENDISDGDAETAENSDGDTDIESDDDPSVDGDLEAETSESDSEPDVEVVTDPLWDGWMPSGSRVRNMLGVASHMYQGPDDNEDRNFEFARLEELGGACIREHFRWNHIEPADDDWHFEAVDTQVQMATERGIKFIPQVGYDVAWAETGEGDSTLIPEEYGEFVRRVGEEYCDKIKDYEFWNEPDMSIFWEPEPNPEHYGKLLKAGYTALKEVCPDARVSIGGLASYSNVNLFERWWFLKGLYEAHPDIADYFDVLSLHPYTFLVSYPPENDEIRGNYKAESQTRMTEMAREILADMGKPDAPIWYTEVGWPTFRMEEATAARYLARSALLALRDGIEYYLWYTFYDETPEPGDIGDWGNYFGLFAWPEHPEHPRAPKAAWYAMKALADVMGDARFARDLSQALELPNDVYVLGFENDDHSRVLAMWDGREMPDNIENVKDEGGPDTSYELTLPLPQSVTSVRLLSQTGKEIARIAPSGAEDGFTLTLTLTTIVRYLVLEETTAEL